jgi:calcineurin-like phosphoesterase family protein
VTVFVTADQHWGHTNILKLGNRIFSDITEHDLVLIVAWNNIVGKDDVVYHLGDLTLGNAAFATELLQQLNGSIRLLAYPWHHDSRWIKVPQRSKDGLVELEKPIVVVEHAAKSDSGLLPVVLCHYPFEIWDRKHFGAVHLHGHTHGGLERIQNRLDVGVDMAFKLLGEYRPFSMDEAVSLAMNQMGKEVISV